MTPGDVRNFYKTTYRFMKDTGMGTANMINWERQGFVPEGSQYKLEKLTKGALKFSKPFLKRHLK